MRSSLVLVALQNYWVLCWTIISLWKIIFLLHACKSVHFHLYNFDRIQKHLSKQPTEQLVWLLCFDNFKARLLQFLAHRFPCTLLLQWLQNTAARIVNCNRTSCHTTPLLRELHWLPVSERVKFKIPLLVFKCSGGSTGWGQRGTVVPGCQQKGVPSEVSVQYILI